MVKIRVPPGEGVVTESLCLTCTHGQVICGPQHSQQRTICHLPYPTVEVHFPVRFCTDHKDKRVPKLDDMKEVAHVLVRGQRGKRVGFVTPDQYRELQTKNDD